MCWQSYQTAFSTRNHGCFSAGIQSSTAGLTSLLRCGLAGMQRVRNRSLFYRAGQRRVNFKKLVLAGASGWGRLIAEGLQGLRGGFCEGRRSVEISGRSERGLGVLGPALPRQRHAQPVQGGRESAVEL